MASPEAAMDDEVARCPDVHGPRPFQKLGGLGVALPADHAPR